MRISDWSSDVCSSDLPLIDGGIARHDGIPSALGLHVAPPRLAHGRPVFLPVDNLRQLASQRAGIVRFAKIAALPVHQEFPMAADVRSEERRVGKECVSTFRSRWSTDH